MESNKGRLSSQNLANISACFLTASHRHAHINIGTFVNTHTHKNNNMLHHLMSPFFIFLNQIKAAGQQYLLFILLPTLVLKEHQEIQQTRGQGMAFSLSWSPLRCWCLKSTDGLKVGGLISPCPSVADPGIFMCLEHSGLTCDPTSSSPIIPPSLMGPTTSKIPLESGDGGAATLPFHNP